MRILVCGGRDYKDWETLRYTLYQYDHEDENTVIITGGCPTGADDLAATYAMVYLTGYKEYKADWKKYGRRAGPFRNQQMLDEGKPDLVIAFPGGNGTADMVRRTILAGINLIEIENNT